MLSSADKDGAGTGVAPEAVRDEVERILASAAFAQSERLSRFLRFTVEKTLHGQGDQVKEYCLGVEVFDRQQTYDPRTDPIVRVEAGRLRSKLAKYYETDGCDDSVLISFPKGSYIPAFQRRQRPEPGPRLGALTGALRRPSVIALLVLAAVAVVALYRAAMLGREVASMRRELARQEIAPKDFAPLWGRLLDRGTEAKVVFGSPMFFISEENNLFLRLMGINDAGRFRVDPGFQAMERRLGTLLGPRYDYALMGDARALQRLTAFLARAGCNVQAVPADQAIWEDLQGSNIIFLGAARMIPLLARLPVQQDFEVGPDNQFHNRNPGPGEEKVYPTSSHRDMTYAVVAHFPGLRAGREIMLLTAHSEPGIMGAVSEITRPEAARALVQKLEPRPAGEAVYYQMLLRVIADRGVPVKTEYVTHHPVKTPLR